MQPALQAALHSRQPSCLLASSRQQPVVPQRESKGMDLSSPPACLFSHR